MARLRSFWENYKVLIVMGSGLGLIHWGWYTMKSSPLLHKKTEGHSPEPGIVSYVSPASSQPLPPLPEVPKKKKGSQ